MTNTQLPTCNAVSRPTSVHNGEPSWQDHELFRPNLRDIDLVISVQTMINAI
jgi:hypothetical protein